MATTHAPRADLVGRDPELAALAQAVDEAGAGRGRVVLLTGEAGIGKTCVAEAADELARAAGFRVVWGRCSADDAPAYWPWSQVLSAIGEGELMRPGRFPTRAELFAAVAEAVLARSRQRPLVVVAEDLHWADSGSLRLAEFLAAVVAGERLLLLMTSREESADRLPNAAVRRIALAGLDLEQTGELVRRYVESDPADEYLAEVFRRTGGNPFFVSEVAHLQASRHGPAGAVPAGVRQVLEHRLARLPQGSVELLQMASVRPRAGPRDVVRRDRAECSGGAAPAGGRDAAGSGSGRAGAALVAGVGCGRPAAHRRASGGRGRHGGGRTGARAGGGPLPARPAVRRPDPRRTTPPG